MPTSIRNKLAHKTSKLARPKENIKDHPAAINNHGDGSFRLVDIDLIHPDPNQPRQIFDEVALHELADSIKQKGILQPVIIRIDKENKIWLVAGERRWRAAQAATLEKVPAIITTGNPAEISLIENIQRENLKPIEEAEAYARVIEEFGYTQEKLAEVIGKAKSTVSETMSLNKLPDRIKDRVRRTELPRRLLLEVSKQKTLKDMEKLLKIIQSDNLKSDQVRDLTRQGKRKTRRTLALIAMDRVLMLSKALAALDIRTADELEKVDLLRELQHLKKQIEKLLD